MASLAGVTCVQPFTLTSVLQNYMTYDVAMDRWAALRANIHDATPLPGFQTPPPGWHVLWLPRHHCQAQKPLPGFQTSGCHFEGQQWQWCGVHLCMAMYVTHPWRPRCMLPTHTNPTAWTALPWYAWACWPGVLGLREHHLTTSACRSGRLSLATVGGRLPTHHTVVGPHCKSGALCTKAAPYHLAQALCNASPTWRDCGAHKENGLGLKRSKPAWSQGVWRVCAGLHARVAWRNLSRKRAATKTSSSRWPAALHICVVHWVLV